MAWLAEATVLGKLSVSEVYEYYDIPRLFVCQNQYGQLYLVLSVEEDDFSITWLYVPISMEQFKSVRSGKVDLGDAVRDPQDGCLFKVVTSSVKPDSTSTLLSTDIPGKWTPCKGEKLFIEEPLSLRKQRAGLSKDTGVLPGMEEVVAPRRSFVIQAYLDVHAGFSSDRVIADPKLNTRFLERCKKLGLFGSDYKLNLELMNARKAGQLPRLRKRQPSIIDAEVVDKYYFACELAIKYFRLTKGVTLDQILCDPELAKEFDAYAQELAPGFPVVYYRWTAFSVRKRGGLKKRSEEIAKELDPPNLDSADYVRNLRQSKVPQLAGFYLFSSKDRPLFVNQTNNLHFRLSQHMANSNQNGLPDWLWNKPLQIAFASRPEMNLTDRKSMELYQVRNRKPVFNFLTGVA